MKEAVDLSHIAEGLRPLAVPLSSLSLDPKNPRLHNDRNMAAVRESLSRFGQRVPIVVRDGVVIAGNARLEAARVLEWEHVAVISADDLTPEQAAAYGVADNRTAELAEWDFPVLADIMNGLDVDLRLSTGFDQKDFERLLEDPTRRRDQGTGDLPFEFKIVIDCTDEKNQSEMLKELMERGVKCRAMTL